MKNGQHKNHSRYDELTELLNDYADIRDELENALLSVRLLHSEIEFAMQDITAEITSLNAHLVSCDSRLKRFQNPNKCQYEVVKVQCELPFNT